MDQKKAILWLVVITVGGVIFLVIITVFKQFGEWIKSLFGGGAPGLNGNIPTGGLGGTAATLNNQAGDTGGSSSFWAKAGQWLVGGTTVE